MTLRGLFIHHMEPNKVYQLVASHSMSLEEFTEWWIEDMSIEEAKERIEEYEV